MGKGLPKSIIKKYGISKKAWAVYRGSKAKRKVYKRRHKSNPRGRVKVARRRRYYRRPRRRRSQSRKIPIATVLGAAAGLASTEFGGDTAVNFAMSGNWTALIHSLVGQYTGWDTFQGKWMPMRAHGLQGLIIGGLISKFVGGWPLNVNRKLAKVPYVKL